MSLTFTTKQQADGSWMALLGERSIGTGGPTEHDAIEELLTMVAEMAARGCFRASELKGPPLQPPRPRPALRLVK